MSKIFSISAANEIRSILVFMSQRIVSALYRKLKILYFDRMCRVKYIIFFLLGISLSLDTSMLILMSEL